MAWLKNYKYIPLANSLRGSASVALGRYSSLRGSSSCIEWAREGTRLIYACSPPERAHASVSSTRVLVTATFPNRREDAMVSVREEGVGG